MIRYLELPLVLLFNRGRLMVLPQAISKATGLREALRTLRLSALAPRPNRPARLWLQENQFRATMLLKLKSMIEEERRRPN